MENQRGYGAGRHTKDIAYHNLIVSRIRQAEVAYEKVRCLGGAIMRVVLNRLPVFRPPADKGLQPVCSSEDVNTTWRKLNSWRKNVRCRLPFSTADGRGAC